MLFSSFTVPIYKTFSGLFIISINKELNTLEMVADIYRFKFSDQMTLESIMKNVASSCDNNPGSGIDLIDKLPCEKILSRKMNYSGIENFAGNISKCANNVQNEGKTDLHFCKVNKVDEIILTLKNARRLYRFVNSYLNSYSIINDLINFVISTRGQNIEPKEIVEDIVKNDIVTNDTVELVDEEISNSDSNNNEPEVVVTPEISDELLRSLLELLILDPQCVGYLSNLICNYYRYYDDATITKDESGKYTIKSSLVLPGLVTYNKAFIISLIQSLNNTELSKANLVLKNLARLIESNYEKMNSIHIKTALFIMFIYGVRHINETNSLQFIKSLDKFILNPEMQSRALNKYLPKLCGIPIQFELNNDLNDFNDLKYNTDEISKKYSFLRGIDQSEFIQKVFSEVKDLEPVDMVNGYHTILDINHLIDPPNFGNSPLVEIKIPQFKDKLLYYSRSKKDSKIITETFELFINYLNNPLSLKNNKEGLSYIVKYFDVLSTKVFNDVNFRKDMNNTYQYYLILEKYLDRRTDMSTFLFLIYQLVIPYMYYYYDITLYEDTFLMPYKI